jgi:FkbM family methyltransferase
MLGVLRRRVDLLKVDVERAELLVLQGIAPHHWPIIEQVTMEVGGCLLCSSAS